MNPIILQSQADAWWKVWHLLGRHNPQFAANEHHGQECALAEIQRLQALEQDAQRYRKLRALQDSPVLVAGSGVLSPFLLIPRRTRLDEAVDALPESGPPR
jgi:hypothetical protein